MMKKFLALLVALFVVTTASCGKKDDNALWWLLLGGDDNTESTVAPDSADAPASEETTSSDTESTETTETSGKITEDQVTVDVQDQPVESSDEPFDMSMTKDIDVNLTVEDQNGPASSVLITIVDDEGNILFQTVTDLNGIANGDITIPSALENVTIRITVGDDVVYENVIDVSNVAVINRTITIDTVVDTTVSDDNDGDTIRNDSDAYPDDASKATVIKAFPSGSAIVAFEDLYPGKGDADFNDYVVSVSNERDLNADGDVVEIRGTYRHIAKGAGFNHELYLTVPGNLPATVTVRHYSADGVLKSDDVKYKSEGKHESDDDHKSEGKKKSDDDHDEHDSDHHEHGSDHGDHDSDGATGVTSAIQILPDSSTTIEQKNVTNDEYFKPGDYAEVTITFDSPADPQVIGSAPYDLFLYVLNKKKEIHFPGKYFKDNGKDLYINAGDGFPWAILIPQPFNWPLEKNHIDDRGSNYGCYPYFDEWYESNGTEFTDWYETYDANCVYPYIESSSSLTGFLNMGIVSTTVAIATALLGIVGLGTILVLKKKKA